jgi:hypothetical protein
MARSPSAGEVSLHLSLKNVIPNREVCGPLKVMKDGFCLATVSMKARPSPLSSRESVNFSGWQFVLGTPIPYQNMNCHPDRSEAKWRDLRLIFGASKP